MKHPNPTLVILLLATAGGCAATGPEPTAAASTTSETPSPAAQNSPADTPASPDDAVTDTVATSGEPGGGVVFNVSYRMPANMVCSHDRETGSHMQREHCRSSAVARDERGAAQEFLKERMRNSH